MIALSELFQFLQVTGVPVVFVSALEGEGRLDVMREVVDTYEKWCSRLPTARLNRWLRKVHSGILCVRIHYCFGGAFFLKKTCVGIYSNVVVVRR